MSTCSHLPACPGCPRFGARDPAPEALSALRALCERHGLALEIEVGARRGFRHRARLSVRGRQGRAKIGVFAAGSHRVVDIPNCQIHHPLINEVARSLKQAMRRLELNSYDEGTGSGLVRGLQVVVERASQRAQIVLICNAETPDSAMPLLDALRAHLGDKVHSLFWNGNTDSHNRVLGPVFHQICGPAFVCEAIGGARAFFSPGGFGQNNLDLFDALVGRIHGWVPAGVPVLELYAGSGAIGLGLVSRARAVVFNEVSPEALVGLALGIQELAPEHQQKTNIIRGPAADAAAQIAASSVVIVDPPRKGLDPELLAALEAHPPEQLIYVSCGLEAFLRDAEWLAARGLRLSAVVAYDLFPYTEHVETLAQFRRADFFSGV